MATRIEFDTTKLEEALTEAQRSKYPRVQQIVLEKLAYETRDAERAKMQTVFDRPTPYALNSLYIKRTISGPKIEATIGLKNERNTAAIPQNWFLYPQVEGGARRLKRHEKLLRAAGILPAGWYCAPGKGAKKDAYGNQTGGEILRVLSFLQTLPLAGRAKRRQNMSAKNVARLAARSQDYFVLSPGDYSRRSGGVVEPGVWKRNGPNAAPSLVIGFIKPPTYRKALPFYEVAERTVRLKFDEKAAAAIEKVFGR